MASIPEEVIQRVREAHDIVDVISEYVSLKKNGKSFIGLCPFHSEKSPSFSVVPENQFFHCFGCHTGGDVIKFVMEINGHTYVEAVKELAGKAGIVLPEVEENRDNEETAKKERMREAHTFAAKLYHHVLIHTKYGENAREYLKNRGFTKETIETFQLGYAPNKRDFLLEFLLKRGFNLQEMVEAGLLSTNEEKNKFYDRFSHRIIFPIQDGQGRVIAFGGRLLGDGKPKYLNTSETPIFHKSNTLYNFSRAKRQIRKAGHLVLFEGYVDVVQAAQAGVENTVASLGTSFTEDMARIIRRYASQVTLCYDGDEAGQDSASRAAEILIKSGLSVRVAKLPDGLDPDDYIRNFGGESFRHRILKNALPITAFRLERLRKGRDLSDSIERRRYVELALVQVALLPSAIERDHYITLLSEEFHIAPEVMRQEVKKIQRSQNQKEKFRDITANKWNTNINNGTHMAERQLRPAYINAERKLLSMMLKNKEIIDQVMEELGGGFNEAEHVAIAAEIYACNTEGVPSIATSVIHRIGDPKLQNLVTSLIMDETDEPINEKGISELIQCILDYPRQKELEEMIRARQIALETGDFAAASTLDKQIREKQSQMKYFIYKNK